MLAFVTLFRMFTGSAAAKKVSGGIFMSNGETWIRNSLKELQRDLDAIRSQVWTISDQQEWARQERLLNPAAKIPRVEDILVTRPRKPIMRKPPAKDGN